MAEKFQNKYRIASARLPNWDYRSSGAYFITICTAGREHYFGEMKNGKMHLSNLGVIADIFWHEIPARKSFVKLGEYVIMPNHMHGILIIDERFHIVETLHATSLQYETNATSPTNETNATSPTNATQPTSPSNGTSRTNATSPTNNIKTNDSSIRPNPNPPQKNEIMSQKSPKSNSVSTIIRSYKSAVTKHANRLDIPNGWQTRFHDHIIRDDTAYQRISTYIKNNPKNWRDDKFFNAQQSNS
mgnify:CR=1 FL=1